MKKVLILSLVATLGGSSLALAHEGRGARFARMDADGDGRVTKQELLAHKLSHFDKTDTNKDGRVTPEERKQAFKNHGAKRFEKKDTNGDGLLSQDELSRMPADRFAALDTNGDGGLSTDELKAGHHGKKGKRGGKGHGKWKDATFERSQVAEHVGKRFAKLDGNGDGVLTADEMKRSCKHGRRGHGRGHGHGKPGPASDRDAG